MTATHPIPGRCPVCSGALVVTRVVCGACATSMEGRFSPGGLQRLSAEQLGFAEVFLRCRGKIKDVEEALGVSYPTVVARLDELVAALGAGSTDEETTTVRRQAVLDELAAGTIDAATAATRLRALR